MSVYVVDASVAFKWFVEEAFTSNALTLLRSGNELHAPDILDMEIDSVICKWIRRGLINLRFGEGIRRRFRSYTIKKHEFGILEDAAFLIANKTKSSYYDCLYVALAIKLNIQVVTADRRLYDSILASGLSNHILWVEDLT